MEEFLHQKWNKKYASVLAPNIIMSIDRFNTVSNWVSSHVVVPQTPHERVIYVAKFIRIAHVYLLIIPVNIRYSSKSTITLKLQCRYTLV